MKCCHARVVNVDVLEEHLLCNEINKIYSFWTKHGENLENGIHHDFHDIASYASKEIDIAYELDHIWQIHNFNTKLKRNCRFD